MRKNINNNPNFEYWEHRKANEEFSFHFSHGGRITMTPDNHEEILAAAKKLYGDGTEPFEEELEELEETFKPKEK